VQYNELGAIPDSEVQGGSGNPAYTAALAVLDADMAQYVHDNTDDEFTHQNFLNAYLASKGADTANLEPFRTLPGSTATGSSGILRLTNLMQLTLDTSWWTRYRSSTHNPDLDPNFTFPQAIPTLAAGQHTAIPRTDDDTKDPNFLQAIANTAGFHFPTIEQGGNGLYPSMAKRATSVEVRTLSLRQAAARRGNRFTGRVASTFFRRGTFPTENHTPIEARQRRHGIVQQNLEGDLQRPIFTAAFITIPRGRPMNRSLQFVIFERKWQ